MATSIELWDLKIQEVAAARMKEGEDHERRKQELADEGERRSAALKETMKELLRDELKPIQEENKRILDALKDLWISESAISYREAILDAVNAIPHPPKVDHLATKSQLEKIYTTDAAVQFRKPVLDAVKGVPSPPSIETLATKTDLNNIFTTESAIQYQKPPRRRIPKPAQITRFAAESVQFGLAKGNDLSNVAKDITDILKKTANMASESRVTKVAEEFDQRLTSKVDVDKVLEKVVVVEVAAGVKPLVESKTAVDKIVKEMERRLRSVAEADQVLRNADTTEVVAEVKTLLESKKAVDRVINELERRLKSEGDGDKVPEKADIVEVAAGVKSLLRSKTDIDNSTRELRGLIEANAFIGEAAKDLKEMIDSLETDDPAPRRAQIALLGI
ncbi:hypothetical protein B0J14DRAFT_569508 [Halenospora varia]|nr:hypothetical protein B0J14DRAFT_569508 [Halenospora varia]